MTDSLAQRHHASRTAPSPTHTKTDAIEKLSEFIDPIMGEFDLEAAAEELYDFADNSWDFRHLDDELMMVKIMDYRHREPGEHRWSDGAWIASHNATAVAQ